jgi:hypothetical protein
MSTGMCMNEWVALHFPGHNETASVMSWTDLTLCSGWSRQGHEGGGRFGIIGGFRWQIDRLPQACFAECTMTKEVLMDQQFSGAKLKVVQIRGKVQATAPISDLCSRGGGKYSAHVPAQHALVT